MVSSKKLLSIKETAPNIVSVISGSIQRFAGSDDRIVVALSGGVDSVVLLHALTQTGFKHTLSAIHVNHGISANADKWADFCRSYCAGLQVRCECVTVTVGRNTADGLEGAARKARHQVFRRCPTDWIVLGHHRDDQAETLMFNLLRGCGLDGATAIRERNGRLLRPMLSLSRAEVLAYAEAHRLTWCDDESNLDCRHARNFLRHEIFPVLKRRFPTAGKNYAAAAARFAEARELLDDLACSDLSASKGQFPVRVDVLVALGEARARNAMRYLLNRSNVMIPSEAKLRETLRQLCEAAPDRHPSAWFGDHRLYRQNDAVYLDGPVLDCDKS